MQLRIALQISEKFLDENKCEAKYIEPTTTYFVRLRVFLIYKQILNPAECVNLHNHLSYNIHNIVSRVISITRIHYMFVQRKGY